MEDNVVNSDQQLVSDTHRDKRAFSRLVERYEQPLRRYVRRLGCSDEHDVEDVLQEIFIKVFINLNEYDPSLKFSSWIYRVAHNETISFFRKKKVRPGVLQLSAEDVSGFFEQLADETDVVAAAEARDDAVLLRAALSELEQRYKEVLVLRFLEEKSYTEIGDILKMPEGTVATLISRGKKELTRILHEQGINKL